MQALAITKIQTSIHQKKALSKLYRNITNLVITKSVVAEVTNDFPYKFQLKTAGTRVD